MDSVTRCPVHKPKVTEILEDVEQFKKEEADRARQRRREERERLRREAQLAEQRAKEEAERARIAKIEEENRIRREQEEKERAEYEAQVARDREALAPLETEVSYFCAAVLAEKLEERRIQEEKIRAAEAEREERRRRRQAQKVDVR